MQPSEIANTTGRYLLYFLLIITPLLRGSVLPWHKTLIAIFAFLILAVAILEINLKPDAKFQKSGLEKPFIAFLVLYIVSAIFSQSPSDTISTTIVPLSYICIFYATINLISTRKHQIHLVYVIIAMSILIALMAIIKSINPSLLTWWYYPELSYPKEMFSGPYGNHNHLAGYLEMVIPLALSLYLIKTRRGVQLAAISIVTLLLVICHIMTLSRGGWFSLSTALVFMTFILLFHSSFKNKKLLIGIFIVVSSLAFFVLSGSALFERALTLADEETVVGMNGRILAWTSTLEMSKQFPLLGTGPGTFVSVFPQFQEAGATNRFFYTHNDYLQFVATLGWLVLLIVVWSYYLIVKRSFNRLQAKSRQTWALALGALTGSFAIALHGCVDFNFHIPANVVFATILSALICKDNFRKNAAEKQPSVRIGI